jgi:hypothetical protein
MSIDSQYIESVLWKTFACVIGLGLGAFAQSEEPKVVVNLDGLRYPPIAREARIQGSVVFQVSAKGRELVSSANPLLTPAAEDNLKTWILPPLAAGNYLITYHFVLDESAPPKQKTVPIGSGFSRFFRRLVGAPTTKVVDTCYGPGDPNPIAPSYTIETGAETKINVIAGAPSVCLNTQVAAVSHL